MLSYVDRGSIQAVLKVHSIVLLDHLDARPAIFRYLIDVCSFQQPERDVAMAQGIERPPIALAVKLQVLLLQYSVELLLVISREETVGRFRLIAFNHSLKRSNSTGGAFAIPNAALAAHFDFEDRLAGGVIFDDLNIPVFKPVGFVRTNTGIGHEQHLVVQLLRKVSVLAVIHRFYVRPRSGVELLVLLWRKPSSVGDFG